MLHAERQTVEKTEIQDEITVAIGKVVSRADYSDIQGQDRAAYFEGVAKALSFSAEFIRSLR